MKISVDAMGGDHAPREVVRGAVHAWRELGLSISLVGQEEKVREELRLAGAADSPIEVVHASEVVGMSDVPGQAILRKRDSSIHVGLSLVEKGEAASFVSAGNSGAVMAGGLMILKRLPGVDRPAIAATIPTPTGPVLLIDAGANVDCKTGHLVQFAIMGEAYARRILGVDRPRVGILSIGEEDSKGTDLTREAGEELRRLPLSFVGNVEGRDFFDNRVDVIVCDGFVGNVALKTMEGMAKALIQFLKAEVRRSPLAMVGAALAGGALKTVKRRLDYSEYGGAPLLGVRGGVVICHGSSDAKAVKNAIRVAATIGMSALDREIEQAVASRAQGTA
jgi:glycerol-3-phosphate acyltransferase PlsX